MIKIATIIFVFFIILMASCNSQVKKDSPTIKPSPKETISPLKTPTKSNRIFSSQNSIELHRDSILNSIGYEPSSKVNQYFYYYKNLNNIHSKKEMFDIMVSMNKGIDSISSIENEVTLFTHYDNMNYFYIFSSDFYRYQYCTWNDLYKTLFSLNHVDRVVWFNENTISTILPSREEWPTIHPPKKIMKKKWYIEDLNYDLILDENNTHFNADWIIEDENYMDSIITANVNLKFKAVKCFEPDK